LSPRKSNKRHAPAPKPASSKSISAKTITAIELPPGILKVESITKKDKLVAYEAQVDTSGKKSEVQVGPDGKPLDHEE